MVVGLFHLHRQKMFLACKPRIPGKRFASVWETLSYRQPQDKSKSLPILKSTNPAGEICKLQESTSNHQGRTIAIGDIHGCAKELQTLLELIKPATEDTIIFLGDYIDRGPDSKTVIETVIALRRCCNVVTLVGNHEVMLLDAIEQPLMLSLWLQFGGQQTLDSYGGDLSAIPDRHLEFIDNCLLFHETNDHLFVHANYLPTIPLDQQDPQILLWTHLTELQPKPHVSGKRVFVGHTPQKNGRILDYGHLICLDTFCFGNGILTAMDIHSNDIWQTDGQI
ncbi:MAG: serine/threonine protein phosphatase [Planctomycetaceae bacterium]|nr:serine/threonine protein phosphatase [Planctomycetaceae bacterium]